MIKIFPVSLDINTPEPRVAFLFVKDLCTYDNRFSLATSIEDADILLIPQFSQNIFAPEIFDKKMADYIASLKKNIVMHNDGGGVPQLWRTTPIGEYIWGDFAELIKVFFSVECYSWHRELMPNFPYVPYDFLGFSDFGLGLREARPFQSKEEYFKRQYDTSFIANIYAPTRDKLWELSIEGHWKSFHFRTHYAHEKPVDRISWSEMVGGMQDSKITFAPDGATSKTERQLFAPSFAAMMMQEDSVEFPFEWVDGVNCLKMEHDFVEGYEREKENDYKMNGHNLRVLNKERTKNKVLEWLNKPDELYEIYKNGYETSKQYELPNYFRNHIGETIIKYL